ncbi:MAG: hypothetical protein AMXMBFR13_43390 [Phycisphaerae bacterium]
MSARRLRVYADTSVFGGCFDEEFASASRTFFDEVKAGRFTLVVSTATQMKWDIQRKLEEEMRQLPEPEKRRIQLESVLDNPLLGPFMRRTQSTSDAALKP